MNIKANSKRLSLITFTLLLALGFQSTKIYSQNTTIIFDTKANVTIGISKEIDNTFTRTLEDKINTDEKGNCVYRWDVNNYQFVQCSFYDGGKIYFPIKEGSNLTIKYKGDGQVEFAGTDKEEIEFYNNRKESNRLFMNSSFFFPNESSYKDYTLFIKEQYSALTNSLDSLVSLQTISTQFSDIQKNDFNILICCVAINTYRNKFLSEDNKHTQDSREVEHAIDEILSKITPLIKSGDILKYSGGPFALKLYYANRYASLSDTDKTELLEKNIWTRHLSSNKYEYTIIPKETQYKLLSLEVLENYENSVMRGDSVFISHISKICPQTGFLPYIKEKRNELLKSLGENTSEVKYITDTINTLDKLKEVDNLKQKVLYIDLWATWCGPCIEEFKHRNKLNELLSNYVDVVPLFISIDEDRNDSIWTEKTKAFNLKGYHLRATKELVTDINKELYESKGIGVPRYILLDKDGSILDDNLPRPSNITKLKEALDKYFN